MASKKGLKPVNLKGYNYKSSGECQVCKEEKAVLEIEGIVLCFACVIDMSNFHSNMQMIYQQQ